MTISAKIIADSISDENRRITTLQLRYPRFIHAELMTHRVFSRNASSSRAIPVTRLIQDVIDDPVFPSYWGKNQKGMQAREELSERDQLEARRIWEDARDHAILFVKNLDFLGVHKQIANRLLEPFSHINVLVTSTEWSNWDALRRHEDAQPEIHELADRMWEAREDSEPKKLLYNDWHLPYVTEAERSLDLDTLKKVSVARCARVSYLTHEGNSSTIEDDRILYERLVGSHPIHASPAEHQATPDKKVWDSKERKVWNKPHLHGNFKGWIQYRKTLLNESM